MDAPRKPEDFYRVYGEHRTYVRPLLRKKHLRDYKANIWVPAEFEAGMSVLELGCGTGLFLAFVKAMGIKDVVGVDQDPKVLEYGTDDVEGKIVVTGIDDFLGCDAAKHRFDRIVMLDVFEHFSPYEGVALLVKIKAALTERGMIVMRLPNCASPWGLQYQFHDLTHKAMYTPGSIRQVALAAGFECVRCVAHRRGHPFKQRIERLTETIADRLLTEPPPLWSANMVAVLAPVRETPIG